MSLTSILIRYVMYFLGVKTIDLDTLTLTLMYLGQCVKTSEVFPVGVGRFCFYIKLRLM